MLPSSVNLVALEIRFDITCVTRFGSVWTKNVRQGIKVTDQRDFFRHFQRVYQILLMKDIFQAGVGKANNPECPILFWKNQVYR